MFHKVSPMVLSSLLILSSAGLPSIAQAAPQNSTAPGDDLFQRGWKYDQGLGTPINIPEAFRLYQQAAAQGNALAKGRLARFYFSGNSVQTDEAQAGRLAREAFPGVLRAAEANDAVAQMIVGTMYADGLGVARDTTDALRWLHKSADQNLPLAKANLGVMYENGQGVPRDITEAAKWFRAPRTRIARWPRPTSVIFITMDGACRVTISKRSDCGVCPRIRISPCPNQPGLHV